MVSAWLSGSSSRKARGDARHHQAAAPGSVLRRVVLLLPARLPLPLPSMQLLVTSEGKTIMAKGSKSDWLSARKDKSKPECSKCDGTGQVGGITCPKCNGFGF